MMEKNREVCYRGTRSNGQAVKASQAILKGLCEDGGLFVPDHIPTLDKSLGELAGMSYQEIAYEVMKLFLTDFTETELKDCIRKAYDEKFDSLINTISEDIPISVEQIKSYIPVILFGFVCFSSLMSSITSSMISLEGKSFSILKSLPVSSFKIIISKVLTAVIIMVPVLVVGDIIMFVRFSFNIIEVLMILISSIILPLVSETIGIIINLKYPKMDAENDTEVVKQSMSSAIAVFTGMLLTGITILLIVKGIEYNINLDIIIALVLGIYTLLCI